VKSITSYVIARRRRRLHDRPMTELDTTAADLDETDDARRLLDVVDSWMAAWNEADRERRRRLIVRSFTENGRYADPFLVAEGTEAIVDSLGELRESFPGHSVRRLSGIERHFGYVRYAWELLDPAGVPVTDGVDVAELTADGRFLRLVGFVSQLVPTPIEQGPS